ncbi:MAG: SCP2 sterol-binding domain-containing protein [Actinobacteria bacterium]|nr:SCP2 sterol-binding domain-containing protein [Actinomycetota bacterium]
MTVTFADDEPNGLADLVGRLIEANLDRRPERRSLLRPAVIQLTASDAQTTATIRIAHGGVRVTNGAATVADLRVVATADDLLALSSAPLRFGLPDLMRPAGRAVIRRIAAGDVRVSGMLRHPLRLSRFTRLLSVDA